MDDFIYRLETPLGPMVALSGKEALYLLEFADTPSLNRKITLLKKQCADKLVAGMTAPLAMIQEELGLYFQGKLKTFKTPFTLTGSSFQKAVWHQLSCIPWGETRSYSEIAERAGNPSAIRAAASNVGANPLAILIPCHRIIQKNGKLGGYAGGLYRKKWLLHHEDIIQ